jgi:MFS family permease
MNQRRLFLGCFFAMIATAFGFVIRGGLLEDWKHIFNLSSEQQGMINGAGLYPFAISIILFSLIVDKIGYGTSMIFAFIGHVAATIITVTATSFEMLYIGTFIYALANGVVEAVVNPVVATMSGKNKTHWLNVLHAGWPGGLVLGGLLSIGVLTGGKDLPLPWHTLIWQWQVGLMLVPTILYGLVLIGQRFPVQERVAAGVSYMTMLREFGWVSSYIVFFLLVAGINQILNVAKVPTISIGLQAAIAIVPTVIYAIFVRAPGRPIFIFMLLIMFLLATTELGTDSWISNIMQTVLGSQSKGLMFLIYTSAIMFILRFFAGPIVHKLSPLGLLAVCAAIACGGLFWLSQAGAAWGMLLLAATFYGCGKSFFWPTTLGIVAEQYPRGGALMLNAMGGVGMLAVGVIGGPAIGTIIDHRFNVEMRQRDVALHDAIMITKPGLFGGQDVALDPAKYDKLDAAQKKIVDPITLEAKQGMLGIVAILPGIMFVCYLILLGYFRSKGGYEAQVISGHSAQDEQFTGGVAGAMEA